MITLRPLRRGRLMVRLAEGRDEIFAAQRLRHSAFLAARGLAEAGGQDADSYDQHCAHMLLLFDDLLVGCFRLQLFDGTSVEQSYSAQFYDLTPLQGFSMPMLEVGRFCLLPDQSGPDLLRLAWAALAAIVDAEGVGLLFGCSSLSGADPGLHGAALASLQSRIGSSPWLPGRRAADAVVLSALTAPSDVRAAQAGLPPLLRSYLGLGGWVSDHAAVDRTMDTLHVFTGVEIAAIPPARAKALRMIAASHMG